MICVFSPLLCKSTLMWFVLVLEDALWNIKCPERWQSNNIFFYWSVLILSCVVCLHPSVVRWISALMSLFNAIRSLWKIHRHLFWRRIIKVLRSGRERLLSDGWLNICWKLDTRLCYLNQPLRAMLMTP